MLSRSLQLLRKGRSALIAAIEVYNKPDFAYREETFSVLAVTAWELLLKAKVLADNGNDPRSIYLYESRKSKGGRPTQRKYIKRNRSRNPHTLSVAQLIAKLEPVAATRLPAAVKLNLFALTEIRDNSVHYVNASPRLAKQVLEVGTACVKNFIEIGRQWFDLDLSDLHLFLMPIGFVPAPGTATAIAVAKDEGRLVNYLARLIAAGAPDANGTYNVALEVNLSFRRSATAAISSVAVSNDPNAARVQLTEEDIRQRFPWDYAELVQHCRNRYTDFKVTDKFHQIRKPLMANRSLVHPRLLDPGNPKSARKDFYNPNIVSEFDGHYTRR